MTTTVQEKKQISPEQFVEAASYLVILMGDEHNKLFDLEQVVANMKNNLLRDHDKVNKVTLIVQTSEEYKQMKKQQAFIKQIEETIRLAKLLGRMKMEEQKLN